jgi:predicted Fe-Mo cluster-binding NifX family protein
MKIAITSTGNALDSTLDMSFGRCACFVIFDTDSRGIEFIPNPYKDSEKGAGTESVRFLSLRGVSKIVSGEFGIKIKPLLDSLRIQMIVLKDEHSTISAIIDMLNH